MNAIGFGGGSNRVPSQSWVGQQFNKVEFAESGEEREQNRDTLSLSFHPETEPGKVRKPHHRNNANNCSPVALLHLAARHSRGDDIKTFLKKGRLNIEVKDGLGRTPLHYAARYGNAATAKALLKKGADINASTKNHGYTPLDIAIKFKKQDVADLLLENGAEHGPHFLAAQALLLLRGAEPEAQ
jgi:ankyrin repeat protein